MSASSRRRPTGRHSVRSARSVFVALLLSTGIAACDAGSTAPEVGGAEALQLSTALVDLAAGETHRLEIARTDDGALAVTWKSEDPQVASVDANGVVTARAVGETTVLASSKNAKASARIKVRGKKVDVASVSVSPDASTTTAIGDTLPLGVTVRDTKGKVVNGAAVTWSSLNPDVAAVDGSGRVVSRAVGAALIVAASGGMADTAAITSRQVVASVAVAPGSGEVDAGSTLRFEAKARDRRGVDVAGTSFVWTSSNTAVATVDNSGAVKGIAAGSAKITATAGGQSASADATVRGGQTQSPPPPSSGISGVEPQGNKVITDRNFNSIATSLNDFAGAQGWYLDEANSKRFSIVQRSDAPLSPSSVVRFAFPAHRVSDGNSFSPGLMAKDLDSSKRQLYARFAVRLSPNFIFNPSGNQKLHLVHSDGDPGARLLFSFVGTGADARVDMILNDGVDGGRHLVLKNNLRDPQVARGQWHVFEVLAVLNDPGMSNGVLRVRMNGQDISNHTNVRYIPAGSSGRGWTEWKTDPVWGGTGGVINEEMDILLDHIYISQGS
jgi:uncharacterized protein YjdB